MIAIHADPKKEEMQQVMRELGMPWPVLFDGDRKVMKSFAADSFPDYYLVDRKGVLRFADLANGEVDRAVAMLLKESP